MCLSPFLFAALIFAVGIITVDPRRRPFCRAHQPKTSPSLCLQVGIVDGCFEVNSGEELWQTSRCRHLVTADRFLSTDSAAPVPRYMSSQAAGFGGPLATSFDSCYGPKELYEIDPQIYLTVVTEPARFAYCTRFVATVQRQRQKLRREQTPDAEPKPLSQSFECFYLTVKWRWTCKGIQSQGPECLRNSNRTV